jgi:hypothetical protein
MIQKKLELAFVNLVLMKISEKKEILVVDGCDFEAEKKCNFCFPIEKSL